MCGYIYIYIHIYVLLANSWAYLSDCVFVGSEKPNSAGPSSGPPYGTKTGTRRMWPNCTVGIRYSTSFWTSFLHTPTSLHRSTGFWYSWILIRHEGVQRLLLSHSVWIDFEAHAQTKSWTLSSSNIYITMHCNYSTLRKIGLWACVR